MLSHVCNPVQSNCMLSHILDEKIKCTNQPTVPESLLSIELKLCSKLEGLTFSDPVAYVYNPLQYAYDVHSKFVYKFCQNKKAVLFLGMNPGPWGMSQTGVSSMFKTLSGSYCYSFVTFTFKCRFLSVKLILLENG